MVDGKKYFFKSQNFIKPIVSLEKIIDLNLICFISKNILLNNQNLKSKKIYIKKNAFFLLKEKIKIYIENWYLKKKDSNNIIFKQKDFLIKIEFFDLETLNKFIYYIEKWIIKKNFAKEHKILKMIGKGGFGKVFLSERIINKKIEQFCLKEIEKKNITNKKSYQYLKNEIKVLRLVEHKNCVKLFEIYESIDSIYIVTEFLNGGTLREKLSKKKLKKREALKLTKNLLEAIQEINKYNMIHRDIKPDNIMFKISKRVLIVKLIDFGLSADYKDHSKESLLFDKSGTACYIAPEIIGMNYIKKFYCEKVDVFSIGVILYEILTGLRPFKGKNYKDSLILNYKCKLDYSFIEDFKLREFVRALTEKNPDNRLSVKMALESDFFLKKNNNIKKSLLFHLREKLKMKQMSLRESLLVRKHENEGEKNGKENILDYFKNSYRKRNITMKADKCSAFVILNNKKKMINY